MKSIGYICLGILLVGCHKLPTGNRTQADINIIDLVDTVVCKSYSFIGDSIVDKSAQIVFSFDYDDCGRLISYRKDNSELIVYNPRRAVGSKIERSKTTKINPPSFIMKLKGMN